MPAIKAPRQSQSGSVGRRPSMPAITISAKYNTVKSVKAPKVAHINARRPHRLTGFPSSTVAHLVCPPPHLADPPR
jgi:hypothetical protein